MIATEARDTLCNKQQRKGSKLLAAALVQNHGAQSWKASQSGTTPTAESAPFGAKVSTLTKLPFGLVCMSPK